MQAIRSGYESLKDCLLERVGRVQQGLARAQELKKGLPATLMAYFDSHRRATSR
jgi:hypothetical protein